MVGSGEIFQLKLVFCSAKDVFRAQINMEATCKKLRKCEVLPSKNDYPKKEEKNYVYQISLIMYYISIYDYI